MTLLHRFGPPYLFVLVLRTVGMQGDDEALEQRAKRMVAASTTRFVCGITPTPPSGPRRAGAAESVVEARVVETAVEILFAGVERIGRFDPARRDEALILQREIELSHSSCRSGPRDALAPAEEPRSAARARQHQVMLLVVQRSSLTNPTRDHGRL